MAETAVRMVGLDELVEDFEKVYRKYPDETMNEIFKQGGNFRDDVISKMPAYYKKGARPMTNKKEWKRKRVKESGISLGTEVWCEAPHFHLVENGHVSIIRGHYHGWVKGKFYAKRTRAEYVKKYPEEMEKFIDRMLKEENL